MNHSESKARPLWQRIPLYLQIVIALILAVGLGILLDPLRIPRTLVVADERRGNRRHGDCQINPDAIDKITFAYLELCK